MGNKAIGPAFHRQMNHHFIVGILQHRPPACAKPSSFAPGAQPIEQSFNFLMGVWQVGLFTMQNLLVFCEEGIAQKESPPALAQQAEKFVRTRPCESGVPPVER